MCYRVNVAPSDKRTRLNNPVNLIALGNKKPPICNTISVTVWLKCNLNMSHMGIFHFRNDKRNRMTKLTTRRHFFQHVVSRLEFLLWLISTTVQKIKPVPKNETHTALSCRTITRQQCVNGGNVISWYVSQWAALLTHWSYYSLSWSHRHHIHLFDSTCITTMIRTLSV